MSNTTYVLRAAVLALASSVVVFLSVGIILADSWRVQTTRTFSSPPATIAERLVDLREWPTWSEVDFELGNPTIREFTGDAGKPEQAATWRGPMGIATVLVTRVEDGVDAGVVEYAIGYKYGPEGDSFGGKFTGSIAWQVKGEATEVTWTEDGELVNLMQRWSNWFGALQVKVGQVQRASLAGLEESIRRKADAASKAAGQVTPK